MAKDESSCDQKESQCDRYHSECLIKLEKLAKLERSNDEIDDPLSMSLLQKFTVETLFYIFYTIVCDSLQGYAALRLVDCGWYYFCPYQKWFLPSSPLPGGTQLVSLACMVSQGTKSIEALREAAVDEWTYFEPSIWARQTHHGTLDADQFLKFEDLAEYLKKQNFFCISDWGGGKPNGETKPGTEFDQVTPQ